MDNLFFWLFTFWEAVLLALLSLSYMPPLHTPTLTKPICAKLLINLCKLFFEVWKFILFLCCSDFSWTTCCWRSLFSLFAIQSTQKRHDTAIFSVENDLPLSWTFIIKMEHPNLLHFTGNRYTGHTWNNANWQQVLRHHCVAAMTMYLTPLMVFISHDFNAQTIFVPVFIFIWPFFATLSLHFSPLAKLLCCFVLCCIPVEELKNVIRICQTLFVAFFANKARPFSTCRLGVREIQVYVLTFLFHLSRFLLPHSYLPSICLESLCQEVFFFFAFSYSPECPHNVHCAETP